MGQSAALRNDNFRSFLRLPSLATKPPEPKLAKKYQDFVKHQREAQEKIARGEQEAGLGKGVLRPYMQTATLGSKRETSIGVIAPTAISKDALTERETIKYVPDAMMEAANRGDRNFVHISTPARIIKAEDGFVKTKLATTLNVKNMEQNSRRKSKSKK